MLKYKLERTRKCIVANGIISDAAKVANQIHAVEVLLSRVANERYYEEISKDFRKKYGRLRIITGRKKRGSSAVSIHFKYQHETR